MTLSASRGAALAAVLTLVLTGCGLIGSDASEPPDDYGSSRKLQPSPVDAGDVKPDDPRLARFHQQELTWESCRDEAECARLEVPVDYAEPGGATIEIALLKVPATGKSLGAMVVNPGGPGASGVEYAASAGRVYGPALRASFDVVGFDPRGVADSAPVECVSDDELNELLATDPDPDTDAEVEESDALFREFGQGCLERNGELVRHVSTVEVARDLDVLRAALDQERLTYFGASYGTLIGATYADLFPTRVGRFVLDGAVDPQLSTVEFNLDQARGFETALERYVEECIDDGDCYLGSSVEEGTQRVRSFLDEVEGDPLPTSSERELTIGNAIYGVYFPLYDESTWAVLDVALEKALNGDGSLLMTLADAYLRRNAKDEFQNNSFQVFYAVNCLDHDDAISSKQLDEVIPRFEKASPTFGSYFAYSTTSCDLWPVHSGSGPKTLDAAGAPPIMVVGTTRDPATPLAWARSLAEQLESGLLVTRDGDGHTGYGRGNDCVDETVESFLVEGDVPEKDVTC